MHAIYDTLTKAYQLTESAAKPYPPEISMILSSYVSPEHIIAFDNNDLYLSFIRTLVDNRENVSFPDTPELFSLYFKDCLRLRQQMEESPDDDRPFSSEAWLACCVRLLENLKTPYYPVYAEVLFDLNACFPDAGLFEKTLKIFYSLIIRSDEDTLSLIGAIARQGKSVYWEGCMEGGLLADLLVHHLSVFADGKDLWVPRLSEFMHMEDCRSRLTLLRAWLAIENRFMEENPPAGDLSLAGWLCARDRWLRSESWSEDDLDYGLPSAGDLLTGRPPKAIPVDSHFLNTYAYNMTTRSYTTNPAIGREQEISDLELILISPKKSPILIGDAGVGKTSVVEGLAWLLQRGEVPDLLKKKSIFKLTTTSLLSGTKYVGEMEERIRQLTGELEKYPDVILFIDEIHTIVGAGSTESSHNDISNMLKPFIDRGDIKIIGATTIQEYEAYLLPDRALARRFYPITIEEPDEEMTLRILLGTIPAMEKETRVKNTFSREETEALLTQLIRLSDKDNQPAGRITRLPELPLTILEMAFSYAGLHSRKELAVSDLVLALRHTNLLSREVRDRAEEAFSI